MEQRSDFPRLLRPVEPRLALYLRPGRNDHWVLTQALAEGLTGLRGIIFNPGRLRIQQDLREEAGRREVEKILDTRMLELASPVAEARQELMGLGWAFAGRKEAVELKGSAGQDAAKKIAEFVVSSGFTAVLAPTHYLTRLDDSWMSADRFLTESLRYCLDAMGGVKIPVYYPLALPSAAFRDASYRQEIIGLLKGLPIDAIWRRVHPFGTTTSGPVTLRGYIEACRELHQLKIPLLAERTGTVGIALLAFGAVGGIESGITTGERFDASGLLRAAKEKPFAPSPRVYLKELGAFLDREQARQFFEIRRMKTFFGCRESCCTRGLQDMLGDPRKHFVVTRAREVTRISTVPVALRPQIYMDDFLRPATDLALQASQAYPALNKLRKRLDSWRGTLGAVARESPLRSWSQPPNGRRIDRQPRASAR